MMPSNPWQRRWLMAQLFAQHYSERLSGRAYPSALDAIPGLLTTYEKQVLYRLARHLPDPAAIVEIGSYQGLSAACMAAAHPRATLHCVDTFKAENITGNEGDDTLEAFRQHTRPYQERITVHCGFSYEMVEATPRDVALLFVDGDHSWQGVTNDLRLYGPRLRAGGVLVLHDSAHPPIRRAIERYVLPASLSILARLPNMLAVRLAPERLRVDELAYAV